jgi:hypothetical protein
MDEPVVNAPEGVELGFRVYLRSDSSELVAVIALDGMTQMREFNDVDVEGLIKSLGKPDYLLLTDWRVMTRKEIADYRKETLK